MICKYCGAKLSRDARRCSVCGRPVTRQRRGALGIAIAIALGTVAIIAVAVLLATFSGSGEPPEYAQVLDRYFSALERRDAEAYASTRPQAYIAYLTEDADSAYLNYTTYINELAVVIDARMDGYEEICGNKIRFNYRIGQAVDLTPQLGKISALLRSWYGFPEGSVSAAVLVSGTYSVNGSRDSKRYEIAETLLLKIGETWYFSPEIGQSWRS